MAARTPQIFLHVGALNTGTGFLQQLLTDNKQVLLEQGLLFPGKQGWDDQVLAVRDVLDLPLDAELRDRATGAWGRLRSEMLGHPGRASIVSAELLSFASAEEARAVVRSLRGGEVHVILTVRDSSRVIPAQWQKSTQNRGTSSWPDYVDAILSGSDQQSESGLVFQRALNVPRMLEAWSQAVPRERLHVVLVPAVATPRAELWERFASVIGVDPSVCAPSTRQRKASLGYASADLMRRVNAQLPDVGMQAYGRTMKKYLSKQVLIGRQGEQAMTTSRALSEFALNWNRSMSDAIAKSGAHVVGDPSDLDVAASDAASIDPPPDEQVLAAARDAVAGLQKVIGTRTKRLESAHRDAPHDVQPPPAAPQVDVTGWSTSPAALEAAVTDVAMLARHAMALRTRLRRAAGEPDGDATVDEALSPSQPTGLVGKVMRRVKHV